MARVTIYLPDHLHNLWREERFNWVNLSKLARNALADVLEREDGDSGPTTVHLCEVCEHRVGRALHLLPETTSEISPGTAPVSARNGSAA